MTPVAPAAFATQLVDQMFSAGERPDGIEPVDLARLSPFERGLLVLMGLVTQFVEAYHLEPVRVQRLSQMRDELAAADPWLQVDAGQPVVRRRVLLRGQGSGRVYAYGEALMVPERLPARMERQLERGDEGIGRLLRRHRVEGFGELLWCGRGVPEQAPEGLPVGDDGRLLVRCYRLLSQAEPVMRITEWFPPAPGEHGS